MLFIRLGRSTSFLIQKQSRTLCKLLFFVILIIAILASYMYMPDSQISKLQLIQNSAARLITGCSKFSHITPVLYQLHWLPVQVCINFKIVLHVLTFQCLHDMAPTYLKEILVQYVPSRNLRSSHRYLLQCPKFSTKYYGERTFHSSLTVEHPTYIVPIKIKEANSVKSFKTLLKTHLFNQYFVT